MPAPFSDPELIEAVIARRGCSQRALATLLGINEANVSRYRAGLQGISPTHRASLRFLLTAEGEAPR